MADLDEEYSQLRVVPSASREDDGESEFEAYHSIFSHLVSEQKVYSQLANICGSPLFIQSETIENELKRHGSEENVIFNDYGNSTHYKFYSAKHDRIYNPYDFYQIYMGQGNCFAFALYLSSEYTQTPRRHKQLFPHQLKDISSFYTQASTVSRSLYPKVTTNIQLAYQTFVYNDWAVLTDLVEIINDHPQIIKDLTDDFDLFDSRDYEDYEDLVEEEKSKKSKEDDYLKEEEYYRNYWGIPLDPNYTFSVFWDQFQALLRIDATYLMTWDHIIEWDTDRTVKVDNKRTGIEGATTGEVDMNNYKLPLTAGRKKRKKTTSLSKKKKITKHKLTKNKKIF
jgi:hypothetical protein